MSNFTPEVVLWLFLRMEMAKRVQNAAILAKIQVQYETLQGELNFWTRYFTRKYNYGRFCACAMAKKPEQKHGAFAESSHPEKKVSHVQVCE